MALNQLKFIAWGYSPGETEGLSAPASPFEVWSKVVSLLFLNLVL